jgi:hypothetical protein
MHDRMAGKDREGVPIQRRPQEERLAKMRCKET